MSPESLAVASAVPPTISDFAPFTWDDPFRCEEQLASDERQIRDAARSFGQERLFPRVLEANRHEHFDRAIMIEMGRWGSSAPHSKAMAAPGSARLRTA